MIIDTYRKFKRTSKKSLLLRLVRGSLNPWLIKLTSLPDYNGEKSIVLLGGPRSGTTWLAEIISTIPKSALLFEPLYLPKVREARVAGMQWHKFLLPDDEWPEGEVFCRQIFSGKILNPWTTSFMPVKRAIRPQVWVIKMVRANMMLGWMLKKFPFLKPALLVRHPCASILSMRQQGWPLPNKPPHLSKFETTFPHVRDIIAKLKHPIEYSAAMWCISYYPALLLSPHQRYIVVSYERLVQDGEEESRRLFNFFQLDMPIETLDRLRSYSQMTKKDSPMYKAGNPLAKWKTELSSDEVHMILNVVKRFGLDFYNEDIEPDYDRLYGPCPIKQ